MLVSPPESWTNLRETREKANKKIAIGKGTRHCFFRYIFTTTTLQRQPDQCVPRDKDFYTQHSVQKVPEARQSRTTSVGVLCFSSSHCVDVCTYDFFYFYPLFESDGASNKRLKTGRSGHRYGSPFGRLKHTHGIRTENTRSLYGVCNRIHGVRTVQ